MYFSDRLYSSMSNNVREDTVDIIYMKNNGTVTQRPKIGKKSPHQSPDVVTTNHHIDLYSNRMTNKQILKETDRLSSHRSAIILTKK